jgi:hypothetical protein
MQKRQGHGNGQILLSYSLNKNLKQLENDQLPSKARAKSAGRREH